MKKPIFGFLEDILINSIKALKDEDYQRRVWFRLEGPEVDSYIDTTIYLIDRCQSFFKDSVYAKELDTKNYMLLRKLYDLVLDHVHLTEERMNVEKLKEKELLDDPKWRDIQILANELDYRLREYIKREDYK